LGRRKRRQELITKTAGEEKMGRERKPTSTTTTTTATTHERLPTFVNTTQLFRVGFSSFSLILLLLGLQSVLP
jgi:hypothetical protein